MHRELSSFNIFLLACFKIFDKCFHPDYSYLPTDLLDMLFVGTLDAVLHAYCLPGRTISS